MKNIALLTVLMLLLVSCTAEPTVPIVPADNPVVTEPVESQTVEVAEPTPDADIIISGGKLDPEDLVIQNNKESELTFHNTDDVEYRLDIPIYGAEITEDLAAGQYVTVILEPKNVGFVPIELNVVAVGTIKVE